MTADGWLADRVALLVGAGSGIGRAVLDAYRREGARVAVLELSPEKCEELRGVDGVVVVEGDATSGPDNERAVSAALQHFGRLDILASFVGVFDFYLPLAEIPDDRFEEAFAETYAVNVKSAMLAARAALPALRMARGAIVLTLSSSSFFAGRGGALYVSSKFALRGLVLQLAHDLAPDVRVNGVAPGGTVRTDLRGLRSLDQRDIVLDRRAGREEQLRERTPLHVALTPDDHAGAYVFLASERACGITGEIVRSDGGLAVR